MTLSLDSQTTDSSDAQAPLAYGSLGRRALAFLLDGLILAIPMAMVNHILPVAGTIVVWFFYAPVLEASDLRATIGKHLCGIQVTDENGRRISFRASLMRNFMKWVSTLLVFLPFFAALFTKRKQTLHDILAETVVVYGRSTKPIQDAWVDGTKEVFNLTTSTFTPEPPAHADSIAAEIEKLEALKSRGTLTEAEFQEAKRKVLNQFKG